MSAGVHDPRDAPSTAAPVGLAPRGVEGGGAVEVCPFLRSQDGGWSSTHSSRELRCWAVRPAALPAISKQRQTCLVEAHAGCATFLAAIAPDGRRPPAEAGRDEAGLWPETRPVPVSLDPVHVRPTVGVTSPRPGSQALLVVLMVVAFLAVVIARTTSPSGTGSAPGDSGPASMPAVADSSGAPASPSSSPAPSASPSPSVAASPSPAATPSASVAPPPSASASAQVPSGSPSASAQTYRVRSGDTLSSIAARYSTTVKALAAANGITDVRTIHVGQVLVIP